MTFEYLAGRIDPMASHKHKYAIADEEAVQLFVKNSWLVVRTSSAGTNC